MRSDIFKIRAFARTLGVDFYKEILNNNNLYGILTNIEKYPETIASFYKMLEEKEKERFNILLDKAITREEKDRREHKKSFVEKHQQLSIQELNERLLATVINIRYASTNDKTLEDSLKELYMDINTFEGLLKNQSEVTKEPKITILYELSKAYEMENDQKSRVYLVKNFIRHFLQTVKDINTQGYEVMFKSKALLQTEDPVNAYDIMEYYLEFTPKTTLENTLSLVARELMKMKDLSMTPRDLLVEL